VGLASHEWRDLRDNVACVSRVRIERATMANSPGWKSPRSKGLRRLAVTRAGPTVAIASNWNGIETGRADYRLAMTSAKGRDERCTLIATALNLTGLSGPSPLELFSPMGRNLLAACAAGPGQPGPGCQPQDCKCLPANEAFNAPPNQILDAKKEPLIAA